VPWAVAVNSNLNCYSHDTSGDNEHVKDKYNIKKLSKCTFQPFTSNGTYIMNITNTIKPQNYWYYWYS
jgi:hypothetical protein